MKKLNLKGLILEFGRYLIVGGLAFLLDAGTLYLLQTYLFYTLGGTGILLATAIGFIVGLIFNYILSNLFVFKNIDDTVKQHHARFFIIFTLIGVIGLGLTELGMYAGILLLGEKYYMLIKIFVAAIVLFWNYIARKIFIFKGEKLVY